MNHLKNDGVEYARRQIQVNDTEENRHSWNYNGRKGAEFRKFNAIITKADNLCSLSIEDIRGEILRTDAFHVVPDGGLWGKPHDSPFHTADDAERISPQLVFAFKPLLMKMGLKPTPGTLFEQLRKNFNIN